MHGWRELGLPPALSAHNSYFLWGPGDWDGEVLIVIDDDRETLLGLFEEVELAGRTDCTDCMPYEDDLPIWVCRRLKLRSGRAARDLPSETGRSE
jgi:hypothetical protein